jgi:hypothetical protein
MATVEDGIQAQIRNIEATYGRPLPAWFDVIAASGCTKHADVVAMLKAEHGMTHGAAHRVSLLARQAATPAGDGGDPADALYAGPKAGLRPIHDAVMRAVSALGPDVEIAPKKGYLSLRRRKQFAMIQPSTASRVDVALILPGVPAAGRLEPAGGFNALFTHRVRITAVAEVDAQLLGWLSDAYRAAG